MDKIRLSPYHNKDDPKCDCGGSLQYIGQSLRGIGLFNLYQCSRCRQTYEDKVIPIKVKFQGFDPTYYESEKEE